MKRILGIVLLISLLTATTTVLSNATEDTGPKSVQPIIVIKTPIK